MSNRTQQGDDTDDEEKFTSAIWKEKFNEVSKRLQEAEKLQQRHDNSALSPSRTLTHVSAAGGNFL